MSPARYMLDTNIVSAIMRSPVDSSVRLAFDAVSAEDLCVSIVTAAELKFGLANKYSAKLAQRLDSLFEIVEIIGFEQPADKHYADIRAYLARVGRPIGSNDLLIAAHARSLDIVLVTDNVREFSRVPNLRVENWLD